MRKAFTLMELMVSIVLIVLITLFLFGAIASSKLSNDTLSKHSKAEVQRMDLFELMYRDVIESVDIKSLETKDKHFNILEMQTQNSIYDIAAPYVTYYVNAKTNVLTRLESAREIKLPVNYESENFVLVDELLGEVAAFNFYTTSVENNASDINTTEENNTSTVQKQLSKNLIYTKSKLLKEPILIEISN
ncbi:MAG: hypothetical protein U9P71_06310 [Campylobacterota bacterium]|nr:hypothetical protein [Campylobacterota bacterium]